MKSDSFNARSASERHLDNMDHRGNIVREISLIISKARVRIGVATQPGAGSVQRDVMHMTIYGYNSCLYDHIWVQCIIMAGGRVCTNTVIRIELGLELQLELGLNIAVLETSPVRLINKR